MNSMREKCVRSLVVFALSATCLLACVPMRADAADAPPGSDWASLDDGTIVLMRHADAPGVGDPVGFKLGDCSTQRNLGETGRAQARRIGEAFARQSVKVAAVISSQWCRTRETAELAFPGQVKADARFNSFFGDSSQAPDQTSDARAVLRAWRGPGVLVVVTHQVNITALTGVVPASGEGVVVKPSQSGITVVGRLRP